MNSNKSRIIKWVFVIIVFLILFVIIIPLLINNAFQRGVNKVIINTDLSSSDILIFYGAALSFIGTIVLGALALWQNKKLNDVNRKLHDYQRRQKIGLLSRKIFTK